jgi:protein kinase X
MNLYNRKLVRQNVSFYVAEVVCALRHLHAANVIYRDLKSEHVMIDSTGHCKLIDLGFAKEFKSRKSEDQRTYTICGTPEYTAPEVIKGIGAGFPADVWSLGVLITEMLTG